MKTFHLTLSLDMRVVAPAEFTQELRGQAQREDATPFLKDAQAQFPADDEAFTLHVLKNGIRKNTRAYLQDLFVQSGLGGTLSPASLKPIDRSPPTDAAPVSPEVVALTIPDASADADQSCTQG